MRHASFEPLYYRDRYYQTEYGREDFATDEVYQKYLDLKQREKEGSK
jgi:hypothetical protein